jgi:isopentenyl phosphate kinase
MLLIKLGGSVITDKSKPLTPRTKDIKRLAKEISTFKGKKIIVHGGGSFGHIKAAKYKLKDGFKGDWQREGICSVQKDMRKLNGIIFNTLESLGMPVVSIPSGTVAIFNGGKLEEFQSEIFMHYVNLGITPITFGDVVVDKTRGVNICSGDDIMLRLAKDLKANRCIFVTEVDGIFPNFPPASGKPPLKVIRQDDKIKFRKGNVDVTGSMKRKLKLMRRIASPSCRVDLLNGLVPGRLRGALEGKKFIGTEVRGD